VAEAALERMRNVQDGWLVQSLDGGAPALMDEKCAVLAGQSDAELTDLVIGTCALTARSFAMPLPKTERLPQWS
jgi:hypothetical protein